MKQVVLRARPQGDPRACDFAIEDAARPQAGPGQLLVKTLWVSVDPYMRLGLDETPLGGANGVPLGAVMPGGAVSRVEVSDSPDFAVGDVVEGRSGWREYAAVDAKLAGLRKVTPGKAPLSTALGVLGMPGQTAYAGIVDIGRVKAGETVVVSAAGGAVGSIAGQVAKLLGAKVVGVAGGADKCAAVEALGFDRCLDYKAPDFADQLKAAAPEGIDVYFENVGGAVTAAVLPLMKYGGRMPMCGFISYYGLGDEGPGPDRLPWMMRMIMLKGLEIRGFSGAFVGGRHAMDQMQAWVDEGRIRFEETVVEGLERAPEAFASLFRPNANVGKVVVKVAD
jgi:NADPH-dependent curcumin reductase CurA